MIKTAKYPKAKQYVIEKMVCFYASRYQIVLSEKLFTQCDHERWQGSNDPPDTPKR